MYAVFISRKGDRETVNDYIASFREYSNQKLVDAYNREARTGIVGVHEQQRYLVANRVVMRDRFRHSPVSCESGIMGIQGEVILAKGKVWFK